MAVVSALVSFLTSRNDRGRRGLLSGIVDTAWTVLSQLLMPIVMIEDIDFWAALRRARDIHGRGLVQIAVGEVGLRAIAGLSAFAIAVVGFVVGALVVPLGWAAIVAFVSTMAVLVIALGVLNAFARGAYYTCLYLWAVEVERTGDASQARVPSPLAMALMR
jgi:hypothetical protein